MRLMSVRRGLLAVALSLLALAGPAISSASADQTISTKIAWRITDTTVTLQADVATDGFQSVCAMAYGAAGATPAQMTLTPYKRCNDGLNNWDLTGLTPGTAYQFWAVICSDDGGCVEDSKIEDLAGKKTFMTSLARTTAATQVTAGTARLNGQANPGGSGMQAYFVYGRDPALVAQASATALPAGLSQTPPVDLGSGTATVDVSQAISGLEPGAAYAYRLVTRVADTTLRWHVNGAVQTFTTPSPPPAVCPHGGDMQTGTAVPGTRFRVSGCWSGFPGSGTYTGHGTVRINGVQYAPREAAGTLTIITATRRIATSGPVSIMVGPLPMRSVQQPAISTTYAASDQKYSLGAVDPGSALFGLRLRGGLAVTPTGTGSDVAITVELPALMGGVTGEARAVVTDAAQITSGIVRVGNFEIGPLTMPGVTLTYERAGGKDTWDGLANLILPILNVGIVGEITITDGKLARLAGTFANLNIPLGPTGVTLGAINFETAFNPLFIGGGVYLSAGPSIAGFSLLGIDGQLRMGFNSDVTLEGVPGIPRKLEVKNVPFYMWASAKAQLFGQSFLEVGDANLAIYAMRPTPLVTFWGSLGPDLSTGKCGKGGKSKTFQITAKFSVRGSFYGKQFNFGAGGRTKIRALCLTLIDVGADALVSSKGFGICGKFGSLKVGVGTTWPKKWSVSQYVKNTKVFTGLAGNKCSLSKYEQVYTIPTGDGSAPTGNSTPKAPNSGSAPKAQAAQAAAARERRVRIAGGRQTVLQIRGRGGPPHITVRGPGGFVAHGNKDTGSGRKSRWIILPDPETNVTTVALAPRRAGTYRIVRRPGSPAITRISSARELPDPRLRTRVTGKGRTRTIRFSVRRIRGQRLEFREQGAAGDRLLRSTRRTRGTIRYRLRDGAAGPRAIVVRIVQDGTLRHIRTVKRFQGPRPLAARRVGGLDVRRSGSTVTASWKPLGAKPDHYRVTADTTDGRKILVSPIPGQRKASRATKAVVADVPADVDVRFHVSSVTATEKVSKPMVASTESLRVSGGTLRVKGTTARVKVRCYAAAARCAGTLTLRTEGRNARTHGRKAYSVRSGSSATLSIPLSRQARRTLARRGRLKAVAVSGWTTKTDLTLRRR